MPNATPRPFPLRRAPLQLLAALVLLTGATIAVVPHARAADASDSTTSASERAGSGGNSAGTAGAAHKPNKKPSRAALHPQRGKASIYADKFANRKMANGRRMDPNNDNAASKTLPLGTKAQVTNLETGKSAVVTIEDRGPYRDGRIVDLSPATADKIGLEKKQGLAPVEVKPLAVPENGELKPVAPVATE